MQQFVAGLASAIGVFGRPFRVAVDLADALRHFAGGGGRLGDARRDGFGTGRGFGHVLAICRVVAFCSSTAEAIVREAEFTSVTTFRSR